MKTVDRTEIKPNEMQQICIDSINGKYLVLAGPGTGKTFTVIERIKGMIDKGIDASKILCLTFSDAAANEMKLRLQKRLNLSSVDVDIFTYHAFCARVIDENSDEFMLPSNYKIIGDIASKAFIKECIDEINPRFYRTEKSDPYYYIDEIKKNIEEIKKNNLNKEKYFYNLKHNPDWEPDLLRLEEKLQDKILKKDTRTKTTIADIEKAKRKIAQAKELWDFYELYQKKMQEKRYIDFNDMINYVLNKFEDEASFLEKIANKYEYILVDEYQDTNKSQNAIVFNLLSALKSQNIFVVGDDDQIIYSFQGAKLDTIEKFLENFPDTNVICLRENMRSTQSILDCARKISEADLSRLEINPKFQEYKINKNLISKNENLKEKNTVPKLYSYIDTMQEHNEIVSQIEKLINSSDCPRDEKGQKKLSEIAILAASHKELADFAKIFKERSIPCELREGKNIFEISAVNVLYYYIQALIYPSLYEKRFLELFLIPPFDVNSVDYLTIHKNVSKDKSFINVLRAIKKEEFIEPDKIEEFLQTYDYLKNYKNKENIKNTVLEIGSKTGIFDYYLNDGINRCENIAGLKKFVDMAEEFSNLYSSCFLEEFLNYLKLLEGDDVEIKTDKAPVNINAVQLSTYFAAKGREFEYVFMPSLNSKKWESSIKSLKPKIPLDVEEYKTDKELKLQKLTNAIKLLYVGITRAKHTLYLSYIQKIDNKSKTDNLTEIIANIEYDFERAPSSFEYSEAPYWDECAKTLIKRRYDYKKEFHDLVEASLFERSFSPSAINTYLNCPRQYFYNNILDFRGHDGNPDFKSYGSAMHFALEYTFNFAKKEGYYPLCGEIIEQFGANLLNQPMSCYEQRQIFSLRGKNAIEKYYPVIVNTPVDFLFEAEYKLDFEIEDFKFSGIIDRIEKNSDGTYSIYDYKTGNAKKGDKICPDGENENYYNQMGLYKYFFEKSTGGIVSKTEFVFVEDFSNNLEIKYTACELDEIVEKFKNSISSIRGCEFEPKKNEKTCKYCQYQNFCRMERI